MLSLGGLLDPNQASHAERPRRARLSSLRVDVLWALQAAARAPQARRAMRRAAHAHAAALAVVGGLLVHAALRVMT